jgi:hypothetical protein
MRNNIDHNNNNSRTPNKDKDKDEIVMSNDVELNYYPNVDTSNKSDLSLSFAKDNHSLENEHTSAGGGGGGVINYNNRLRSNNKTNNAINDKKIDEITSPVKKNTKFSDFVKLKKEKQFNNVNVPLHKIDEDLTEKASKVKGSPGKPLTSIVLLHYVTNFLEYGIEIGTFEDENENDFYNLRSKGKDESQLKKTKKGREKMKGHKCELCRSVS